MIGNCLGMPTPAACFLRGQYRVDHIGRLLRSLGWSPQKPERRVRERDEKAVQRWVRYDWPRLKKEPRA